MEGPPKKRDKRVIARKFARLRGPIALKSDSANPANSLQVALQARDPEGFVSG
jgi:hypothetical protein